MFQVKVTDHFAAAHQLLGYEGKCEGLHGHNWKVEVCLEGENLDKIGMLIDFKVLKKMLKDVLEELDHKMLNELEPFQEINPSSELIARYIYKKLDKDITDNVDLKFVSVWESETSRATYYDN
ncbi:MAG: 6-carboxytetrahydropterin synthase QueD [Spirochaetota bacterium]|nr:6-carboxytetrahydropterin synthase QueD [Spirochaetota bacterium]